MTSRTSSTNWKHAFAETYRWSIKRNRGMMALFATLLFLMFPAVVLFGLANANIRTDSMTLEVYPISEQYANVFGDIVRYTMLLTVSSLCALFTLLFAVQLFRYMHNKRSTDLFHALPVQRSAMLLGRVLAGLTALYVPLLLNTGVTALIALFFDIEDKGGQIGGLFLQVLGLMLVLAAAFLFCVLMAVCSGTTLDMVLSVIGVNLSFPILVYSCIYLIGCLLPGFSPSIDLGSTLFVALAPFIGIFLHTTNSSTFFVWWAILTVFLAFSSVYLYRKRKSETAENTFAFQIPKGLIRFLITAVGGFSLGYMLYWYYSSTANFLIGMLLGSFAAHMVVEAIYSRGFTRMKRSLAGYAVFLGAFVIFYGVVATGAFGYVDRMPNLEDIESVTFEDYTYYQEFGSDHFSIQGEQYETLAEQNPKLCQKENLEKVLAFHQSVIDFQKEMGFPFSMNPETGGIQYQFVYHLKNGDTFRREYRKTRFEEFDTDSAVQDLQEQSASIVNSEEYKTSGNLLFYLEPEEISEIEVENYDEHSEMASKTYRLNDMQKKELLEALRQDTMNMDITGDEDYSARLTGLTLVCGNDGLLQPKEGGRLQELTGEYQGKIWVPVNQYVLKEKQNDLQVVQFLKKLGWYTPEN